MNARDKLITENMNLVYMCVHRYFKHSTTEFEDLVQVGMLGLVRAANKYSPETGFAFSSYAVKCIVGAIKLYLRDNSTLIRVPRNVFAVRRAIKAQGLEDKDAVEVAATLRIPTAVVSDALTIDKFNFPVSLDATIGDSDTTWYNNRAYEEDFDAGVLLHEMSKFLTEREKIVVCLLLRGKTQNEIGDYLGIAQPQIGRHLRCVREKLEQHIEGQKVYKRKMSETSKAVYEMWVRGVDTSVIARKLGLTPQTIYGHIRRLKKNA